MKSSSAVPSKLLFSVPFRRRETPFFRGAVALKALKLLEAPRGGQGLRVWVPECAGGEDAYSVAIALLEGFGGRWREIPLCVFATDSDADAIAFARAGRYRSGAGGGVAPARLARFFLPEPHRLGVRPFVRASCRFTTHALAAPPPFSRLQLIVARDVLSALPVPARREALLSFHSALAPGGTLLDPTGNAACEPGHFKSAGAGHYLALKVPRINAWNISSGDVRLRESEDRFQALFSRAEDAVLVRDAETDRILQANAAALRLYGWSLAELLRLRGKDLLAAPEAVRRPKNERRSEERLALPHFRRKDGTMFPADFNTSFMMLQGRPCSLDMVRDAGPRLRAVAAQKRDVEHKAFLGEVVHELRNPLSIIRGSAESLRSSSSSSSSSSSGKRGAKSRKMLLDFIENHSARMARLVDRLLDLSVANTGRRGDAVPVALAELLAETAAAFAPLAKRRGITISMSVPAKLAVLADPTDLPHVFGNLLDNAVKFTPRGGKVEIRGRAESGEGLVSIRDTGPGIAPGEMGRVFERFYRGESARRVKGTGLGLAIVRKIVTANQGRVLADNDPAGGAVFHVALPLVPEPS